LAPSKERGGVLLSGIERKSWVERQKGVEKKKKESREIKKKEKGNTLFGFCY